MKEMINDIYIQVALLTLAAIVFYALIFIILKNSNDKYFKNFNKKP
jgi:hypothetical protein